MFVGFTELCQDDQIKLIKQGSFEVILARYVPLFSDDGMFVPDMSVKVPRSVSCCYFYSVRPFNLVFSVHLTLLERTLAVIVCPSVRPSVKRVDCDKTK